jgi:hypothetical protein
MGAVEMARQEFNPRHATGDLRRHEPELAMRIWIVHVRLSPATSKAAVARQRRSRETVSGSFPSLILRSRRARANANPTRSGSFRAGCRR